jgi:hypothetical protein
MKDVPPPALFKLYDVILAPHNDQELVEYKRKALVLLPDFNNLLLKIRFMSRFLIFSSSKAFTVSDDDYKIAIKLRQELLDCFADIDRISKKIKVSSSESITGTRKLEDNIYFSTIQFLQTHMFTLQLLPSPKQEDNTKSRVLSAQDQASVQSLKKELEVLIEQSKQVEAYLVEATSRRKFEDAQMLKESLDEIGIEISRMQQELARYIQN